MLRQSNYLISIIIRSFTRKVGYTILRGCNNIYQWRQSRKISKYCIVFIILSIILAINYIIFSISNPQEYNYQNMEISKQRTTHIPFCISSELEILFSDLSENNSTGKFKLFEKYFPPSDTLFSDSKLSRESLHSRITAQYTHIPMHIRDSRFPSGFRNSRIRLELPDSPDRYSNIPSPILLNSPTQVSIQRIKILILNGLVGRYGYLPLENHLSGLECPVTQCEFSDQPELMYQKADVVVWYSVSNSELDVPKYHRPDNQIWVFQQYSHFLLLLLIPY